MSRFLKDSLLSLKPYTPGEQIKEGIRLKLNTNESPFPVSPLAQEYISKAAQSLQFYQDPEGTILREKLARYWELEKEQIILGNGSDDLLNQIFSVFFSEDTKLYIPDISYGFYKIYADLYHIPVVEVPLREDLSISCEDYLNLDGPILFANPNAPTGMLLSTKEIESILEANLDQLVIVDEAYIDFGGESVIPLVAKYSNLLVVQTFSKSRSMAGARLGFAVAQAEIIQDLRSIKYSTNPYNVNIMSLMAGLGAIEDQEYFEENCQAIIEAREYFMQEAEKIGFSGPESKTNFVFIKHERLRGEFLYSSLKKRGILVRHFPQDRISEYVRITIGTKENMDELLAALQAVLEEEI